MAPSLPWLPPLVYSAGHKPVRLWLTKLQILCFTVSQFSHSVVSDSLQLHGLQHARLLCPSPTPRAYSNSCPLSWWFDPTISSSCVTFSSCLQSSPGQGHFQWVSSFYQVDKVLELQLHISPSNKYSGLISFRMDWLDLLAVQGTLKRLLQHHSSKPSILRCSAFFIVHLSHPHMTMLFSLWLRLFILSGVISPLFSSSILGTYWPGEFIFQVISFCLFIMFIGFWREEHWSDLPLPSPVDHVLSEHLIYSEGNFQG